MNSAVLRETIRRHLTSVPFIVFLVLLAVLGVVSGAMEGPPQLWQGFLALLFIILSCQLIGPEFSSGTLQLILAKPVNRSAYLLSRVGGVVAVIWIAVWIPFAAHAAGSLFSRNDIDWHTLLSGPVNLSLEATLICGLMAFFGSFTRSYLNVAIYFIAKIVLGLTVGAIDAASSGQFPRLRFLAEFFREHTWLARGLRAMTDNLFPTTTQEFSRQWALMVLTNAAIALFLACIVFRRREVPYGAD